MRKALMLSLLIPTTFLFGRELKVLKNDSSEPFRPVSPSNREEIILHEVDFEGDVSGWSSGNSGGWELSEVDSHSPTHSYNSPDVNDSGEFASYDLFSETISLPLLGDGEIMHFKFWLYNDMPDYIQEDDPTTTDDESQYLADYYGISLPTEAEWEYAARAGQQLEYPTNDGNLSYSQANYGTGFGGPSGETYLSPVGELFPPNPFGL